MNPDLQLADLTACGAHQKGHFLLSSGLHSGDYLQCALYLAHPQRAARAGGQIASLLQDARLIPEIVVAPAMGGLIIGHETARALDLPFIFTERSGAEMVLRRGFGVETGQRIVVIEDVVTTGRSTREVITILETIGAQVIGVASMVNRTGGPEPFDTTPYHGLIDADFPKWEAESCPLCRDGVPIAKPGSRPVS